MNRSLHPTKISCQSTHISKHRMIPCICKIGLSIQKSRNYRQNIYGKFQYTSISDDSKNRIEKRPAQNILNNDKQEKNTQLNNYT